MASGRRKAMLVPALLLAAWALPDLVESLGRPVAAIPGQESAVADQSPFAGSWTASLSQSRRDPNHQFEKATLEFVLAGDTVTLKHGGINASGHHESGVTTLRTDGREQVLPQAPGVVIITRWVGPRVLDTVTRKGDRMVGHGVYEVSADGKTLTATVSGTDASGAAFEQVIVFDRD